nr:PAS domain-containing protein [Rhizobium sp. RCAM05973]
MVFTNARESDNPIIFANDSFLALTGYDRQEVLGQSFDALMARGSAPDVLARLAAIFSEGGEKELAIFEPPGEEHACHGAIDRFADLAADVRSRTYPRSDRVQDFRPFPIA